VASAAVSPTIFATLPVDSAGAVFGTRSHFDPVDAPIQRSRSRLGAPQ
jgi:hypothetical protein